MSRSRKGNLMPKCALAVLVQALPFATADATSLDTEQFALSSNAGDVNCDGVIDFLDVVLLGNHLDGLIALSGTCDANPGDVNLDGLVNEDDYAYLLDLLSGIPTSISLQSDPGDYIGLGGTYLYTQANALLTVTASGGHFGLSLFGDESWSADFQVPDSLTQFAPGTYSNLTRYPFHDPAVGGLSWSGEGRGCNSLTGSFVIERVVYCDGNLALIDLSFEQHCEGGPSALHGSIHWDADDPTTPPGPVVPIPPGLWQPAPGSTPPSDNYVYLESEPGDPIGQGQTLTYTPSNSTITVLATANQLFITVSDWSGEFKTMTVISELQPGYYPDLTRSPFHNPAKGGLNWSGQGVGCNTLTGWFAVDAVTYVSGILTAIDLRFEQHCEGGAPALHGAIHWEQ